MREFSIAVIIPTHNRLAGLLSALNSVLCQTVLPDEIIVVDDGSITPVTPEIFKPAPKSIDVKLLRNKSPRGAPYARNMGAAFSKSLWLSFLDDDDVFFKKKIEAVKKSISGSLHADIVYHKAEVYLTKENIKYLSGNSNMPSDYDLALKQLLLRNIVGGSSLITIKKEAFNRVGGFDVEMPALQDWELYIRLLKEKCSFFFIERPLVKYTFDTSSSSITLTGDHGGFATELLLCKHKEFYNELSMKEKQAFKVNRIKDMVLKSLLKNNRLEALRHQLGLISCSFNIKHLLLLFVIPFGPRFVFKLRSLI